MLLFLKSISSRSFNHQDFKNNNSSCKELTTTSSSLSLSSSSSCISLTVWRKSLIFSCKGFTVIGSDGNLVYRVDNYSGRRDQTILMDASGKPILTICRHKVIDTLSVLFYLSYFIFRIINTFSVSFYLSYFIFRELMLYRP